MVSTWKLKNAQRKKKEEDGEGERGGERLTAKTHGVLLHFLNHVPDSLKRIYEVDGQS